MANAKLITAVKTKIESFLANELTSWGYWDGEDISDFGFDPDTDEEDFMKQLHKIINRVDVSIK